MTLSIQKRKTTNSLRTNPFTFLSLVFSWNKHHINREICQLIEKLEKIPSVRHVDSVLNQPNDLHDITFKLDSSATSEERIKVEGLALDLVIDTEWKLRDITNSDDWHFNAQVVRKK